MAFSPSRPRRGAVRLTAALVLLLAGCGEGAGPEGGPPLERITAAFGGLSDVIVVTAIDRLPLRSAELVDPDGERVAAYSLDVASSPIVAPSPQEDALMSPGAPRRVVRIDAMVATALIRLPDPTRYAKSWRQWRVELQLGDPASGGRDVTLPAPAPRA